MIEQSFNTLVSDYGVLGIMSAVLGFVVYKLYNKQVESQDEIEDELSDLRTKFEEYIERDRVLMLETINNNTAAFRDLHNIIKDKLK